MKVDVSIQCQFPMVADELLAYCLRKLDQCLEWPRKLLAWIKLIFNALCERLKTKTIENCGCDCSEKIRQIEERLKMMEVEMERLRLNQDIRTEKP